MRRLWIAFVPLLAGGVLAKQTLNVFVISDFSLAWMQELCLGNEMHVPSSNGRYPLPSGPFICPSSAYPSALAQFQFTSDVIAGVDSSIPLRIQYYAYSGGDGDPIGNVLSTRENFTEASIPAYTKFCAEGPGENDFERFIKLTITPSVNADLIILFTAASQAQISQTLPILSSNVKKVIVLGLNETIYGKVSDVNAVAICYPLKLSTVTEELDTTSTAIPIKRILFVNDFTSDFIDNQYLNQARRVVPSNSIKCPGNAHPEAAAEFYFTNSIVQELEGDIPLELYYYAYNGDSHPIAPPVDPNYFSTGTEFKDIVCAEDDPRPSDLQRLEIVIEQIAFDLDVIVIFSAADYCRNKGATAYSAYPFSSIIIDDFSDPEVITCMIEAAFRGESRPSEVCRIQTRPPHILFINDFTSDFILPDQIRARRWSNAMKCPGNAHPEAAAEFDFTQKIVNEVSDNAQLEIYYYANNGDYHPVPPPVDPNNFATGTEFKDVVCSEDDPHPTDLQSLVAIIEQMGIDLDIVVLFSATQIYEPLEIDAKYVITVGLNGADESMAYPNSSISITDFSQISADFVACMIDSAINAMRTGKSVNLVQVCGVPTQPPRPPMS